MKNHMYKVDIWPKATQLVNDRLCHLWLLITNPKDTDRRPMQFVHIHMVLLHFHPLARCKTKCLEVYLYYFKFFIVRIIQITKVLWGLLVKYEVVNKIISTQIIKNWWCKFVFSLEQKSCSLWFIDKSHVFDQQPRHLIVRYFNTVHQLYFMSPSMWNWETFILHPYRSMDVK